MKLEKCKICGINFAQKSGHFSIHLKKEHNLTLENYIVYTEYNNIHPKGQCGYSKIYGHQSLLSIIV